MNVTNTLQSKIIGQILCNRMRENNNTQERHKIHVFMANIWI